MKTKINIVALFVIVLSLVMVIAQNGLARPNDYVSEVVGNGTAASCTEDRFDKALNLVQTSPTGPSVSTVAARP